MNKYVQSVRLNGEFLPRSYITHDDIMAGGTLEFTMSAKPNKSFGKALSAAEVATWCGTIPYTMVTCLTPRVPRYYSE